MEEQYSTLTEAITAVFHKEETSLLSLDKICQVLQSPNFFLSSSSGMTPCSSISRRRISSILSSSDVFVRAGPPRSCMWALRPSNPLFLSDGAILSCISTILAENGPLTAESIVEKGDLSGATVQIIRDFLESHQSEYSICCKTTDEYYYYITKTTEEEGNKKEGDDVWWFTGQPLPHRMEFESVISALLKAFEILNRDASIEEVSWVLCLSTLSQNKKISRRKISRELSRRPDLFQHISRAKYSLIKYPSQPQQFIINCTSLNKISNPLSSLSFKNPSIASDSSNSLFGGQPNIINPPQNFYFQPTFQPAPTAPPSLESTQQSSIDVSSNFEFMSEVPPKFELTSDFSHPINQCETPPIINPNDFFDPVEFFSIGFSGTYE